MPLTLAHCALVSVASVAMTPIVVASAGLNGVCRAAAASRAAATSAASGSRSGGRSPGRQCRAA